MILASLLIAAFIPSSKYKTVNLASNVSLQMPEDFVSMSKEKRSEKFELSREPLGLFSDKTGRVDLSITLTQSYWGGEADMAMLKDFYRANIVSLYTKVDFIQDKLEKINKRQFAVFEFVSQLDEKGKASIRKYTYIQYGLVKRKIVVFSFNCAERDMSMHQASAKQIMKSAKI